MSPQWVEDCVSKKMADPKFKPQEGKTKKESAWAVCQTIYKERVKASLIILEPVTEQTTFVVAAEDGGEVLRFRNAVFVVAETNRNRDTILEEELQNLASTLPGRPIDYDHQWQECVGVFTEASVEKIDDDTWGLRVGGLIWADRFPDVAKDVREGRLKLSIEADAETAECSICSNIYARAKDYCEHLLDKVKHNAHRILHGLKAVGGGLTHNPAGTDTSFDMANVCFVAHHKTEEVGAEEETTDAIPSIGGPSMEEQLEKLQAELKEMAQKFDATTAELESVKAAHTKEIEALTASVADLTSKLEVATTEKARLVKAHRTELLKMNGMEEDEIEKVAEDVGTMTDAQFNLLVAHVKPVIKDPVVGSGGFEPGGGDPGGADKNVLTL